MAELRFFARPLWSNLYAAMGLFFVVIGADTLTRPDWWRVVIGLVTIGAGVPMLHLAWLARRRPIVTLDEEAVEIRAISGRASKRISRRDVAGVAWSSPAELCLKPDERTAVQELLATR